MNWLQTGLATRPKKGERGSGDLHVVAWLPDHAFLAVVDGIGHGEAARVVAAAARSVLERSFGPEHTLETTMAHCHEHLRGTRGAVMSLAHVERDSGILHWMGIGNVQGMLLRADTSAQPRRHDLHLRSGVIGISLPECVESRLILSYGDIVIMITDGVSSLLDVDTLVTGRPQDIANRILAGFGRDTDDALVFVARYLGPQS